LHVFSVRAVGWTFSFEPGAFCMCAEGTKSPERGDE
jgi:hypothetical protein